MTESSLRRHAGIFGLVAALISLTEIPLYFMYDGAPPQWDILTRVLVGIVSSTILIIFLVGFRLVICQGRPQLEWAATLVLVSGLMWLTFSMVAQSMEAGTAIVSKVPIDATVDGVLAPGQFLLWGSIGRLMTTLFLSASGFAILRGRLMPAWLAGWPSSSLSSTSHLSQPCSSVTTRPSFTAPSGGVRRQRLPSSSSGGSS
jgi:hypothetical protein